MLHGQYIVIMWRILLFGIICGCSIIGILADDLYRLPKTVLPSKYVVDLKVPAQVFESADYYNFSGKVVITFSVQAATKEIKLHHSSNIAVSSYKLTKVGNLSDIFLFEDNYNATYQIVTLPVSEELDVNFQYELTAVYTAVLEEKSMHGFYKSSYKDENNQQAYLVTTQFQATYARYAFPCFDEPTFKATFQVSIEHPSTLTALSNTANSSVTDIDNSTVKTSFKETPIMSSYLVAFAVSSFTCTSGEDIESGVPYRVCSREEEADDRQWAVEIGPPTLRALETLTGIKYGSYISKMDQIALPDFSAGAMENWGLVTYRETGLLWNVDESSNAYKKSIAQVIAHEFTHMWFGNLVTCDWWDYLFLNEGFARYYQYFAAALTTQLQNWELDKFFNVEQVHTALLADSSITTQALTSASSTPSEVSGKFSTISYNKGAAILRMIETVIAEPNNFISGIQHYLKTYSSKGAVPENLWSSLAQYIPERSLPDYTNFSTVISNWIDKSGHPVVTVTRDNDDVILTQNRFLLSGSDNTQYFVPISYTLSSDLTQFSNTTVKEWLLPGFNLTIKNALKDNSWIVINNKQSGFYRVNYDKSLWTEIKSTLRSNLSNIDVLNRAQIVSDAYNFARAGKTTVMNDFSYANVLDILQYMEHETDYYPWYAAIIGNNHLLQRIGYESSEGIQFTKWMLKLMKHVYSTVPFETINESDQVYTLKQVLILTRACKYGETTCIEKAKALFANYRQKGEKVPKNFRSFVYCNALRHSTDSRTDFDFLWQKYKETKLMSEILTILGGLACTEDTVLLKEFLGKTINATEGIRIQDFTSVWSYVYSSSITGAKSSIEFIKDNYQALNNYYTGIAPTLVANIASYLYSDDQIKLLEELSSIEGLKTTVESALNTTKGNIEWASERRKEISTFLTSSAVTLFPSFAIALILVLLQRLL